MLRTGGAKVQASYDGPARVVRVVQGRTRLAGTRMATIGCGTTGVACLPRRSSTADAECRRLKHLMTLQSEEREHVLTEVALRVPEWLQSAVAQWQRPPC